MIANLEGCLNILFRDPSASLNVTLRIRAVGSSTHKRLLRVKENGVHSNGLSLARRALLHRGTGRSLSESGWAGH